MNKLKKILFKVNEHNYKAESICGSKWKLYGDENSSEDFMLLLGEYDFENPKAYQLYNAYLCEKYEI